MVGRGQSTTSGNWQAIDGQFCRLLPMPLVCGPIVGHLRVGRFSSFFFSPGFCSGPILLAADPLAHVPVFITREPMLFHLVVLWSLFRSRKTVQACCRHARSVHPTRKFTGERGTNQEHCQCILPADTEERWSFGIPGVGVSFCQFFDHIRLKRNRKN